MCHRAPHKPCSCFCAASLALLLLALLRAPGAADARPGAYNSSFNKICMYSARNVSKALFEDGIDGSGVYVMPLETSLVVTQYPRPWHACFGPGETWDLNKLRAGAKLPCFYTRNAATGNYDYREENACDKLIRSNCYCFSITRSPGSYCEPGLGGTGRPLQMPVTECGPAVAGVHADGGVPVDRATVYGRDPGPASHYIALAVKPPADASDTGDFHFWRSDEGGRWSYKAGDTLSRNTYRNGTAITDVEAPDARGQYTLFCGYFQVWPATHKLKGNNYFYSSIPARYKLWDDLGVKGTVTELPAISPAWLAAYRKYFADAGWEDSLPSWAAAKERAALLESGPFRWPPHTYSVRPFHDPTAQSTI